MYLSFIHLKYTIIRPRTVKNFNIYVTKSAVNLSAASVGLVVKYFHLTPV